MNILKSLVEAHGGGVVRQISQQFGIGEQDAASAMSALVPSLAQGMKRNMAQPRGLESLLGALGKGDHVRYVDNPAELARPDTVADGNGILGHLLGSKEASREVAAQAASRTGLDVSQLKQMLPLVAAAMMGQVSRTTGAAQVPPGSDAGGALGALGGMLGKLGGAGGTAQAGAGGGAGGMLEKFLDTDGDGLDVGDLTDLARRFF